VDDVMVPRGKIEGVNLDAEWDDIASARSPARRYTRLPVYPRQPRQRQLA
jgi:Mg2+/Co2+ transporter CorB